MRRMALKPYGKKRRGQIPIERDIKRQIYELGNGLCELCGKHPIADMGHEIIFRSRGGNPTDLFNIIQLCLRCRSREHNLLLDEKPHTKEELLNIVKLIRIKQGFKEG